VLRELRWTSSCQTSENPLKAKFREFPFHALRLTRIIHERSGWLRFARGKADEDPSKAAKSPHIDSDRSKSRSPYSSTKLGFVNNPG